MAACRGLEGSFEYHGQHYTIQPVDEEVHILYRPEETKNGALGDSTQQHRCDFTHASDSIDQSELSQHKGDVQHRRLRRNAINETKYLELVLVNDKRSFDLFNGNLAIIESHTVQVSNSMMIL